MLLELCVNSVESALRAQRAGADRIELCENLAEGGTTPTIEVISLCRKNLHIKLHIMIRPRAGDFFYSDEEFTQMKRGIEIAKQLKADGVVLGILTADLNVDVKRTKELIALAKSLKTTFHRAFDETVNPAKSLENIIQCGADILLTSGQKEKALDGTTLIAELHNVAAGRIEVMAGSGITEKNILEIAEKTGITSFHASAKKINSANEMMYADENMIRNMKNNLANFFESES